MLKLTYGVLKKPQLVQTCSRPAVYLDHWALMNISEDSAKADRFRKVLHEKSGTLELSIANLLEFATVLDERHAKAAEHFLQNLYPNLAFIEVVTKPVIDREDTQPQTGPRFDPHLDDRYLNAILPLNSVSSVYPVSFDGLFTQSLTPPYRKIRNELERAVEPLVTKAQQNWKAGRKLLRLPSKHEHERETRCLQIQLLQFFVTSKGRWTLKQQMDFFHAVVPIAYCDIVLVDKMWADQAHRFCKANPTAKRIAATFSDKTGEMDKFWAALENYGRSARIK